LFELTVEVLEEDGRKASGDISVSVDASMPAHRHGMNTMPQVSRDEQGRYHVSGMLFHMPGHWELHFDVTRDGVTERAGFDVELD
jgi:hypothetical protein